jgi:hypothetical protein
MGRRKAEKSADFSKIRDAEGRVVTSPRFLEISLDESTRGFEPLSPPKAESILIGVPAIKQVRTKYPAQLEKQ